MSYANLWNPTQPLGSAPSDTIDEIIRTVKASIAERMTSIIDPATPWDNADLSIPIKLLSDAVTASDRTVMYPHNNIEGWTGGGVIVRTVSYTEMDGNSIVPIPIFADKTIQEVTILVDCDGQTIDWGVHLTLFSDPPTTNMFTFGTISGGLQSLDVLAALPNFPVNDTAMYQLTFDAPPSGSGDTYKYYGMKVVYNGAL